MIYKIICLTFFCGGKMALKVLSEYLNQEEITKLFPEDVLNEFERICKIDKNQLDVSMLELMEQKHLIVKLISSLKYRISLHEKVLKKIEFDVWKKSLVEQIKFQAREDRRLYIESDDTWRENKHKLDAFMIQLDFLEKISNILDSKHYMIKNYMDYLIWTNGDR